MTNTKEKVYDHIGNEFDSINKMCKYWGVSRKHFDARMLRGYTLADCLSNGPILIATDHLGNQFTSEAEMCEKYGVPLVTYYTRKHLGFSLKDCLTSAAMFNKTSEEMNVVMLDENGNEVPVKTTKA